MTVPSELVWAKATVTRTLTDGDTTRHRRVRFVLDGTIARVFERDGTLTKELKIVEGEVTGKVATFTMENGELWLVEQAGCGCSGG